MPVPGFPTLELAIRPFDRYQIAVVCLGNICRSPSLKRSSNSGWPWPVSTACIR